MTEGRAVMMGPTDNVATVVTPVRTGESITVINYNGQKLTIVATQSIPFAHKVAVRAISTDETIIKYGEIIGRATTTIEAGDHVHVQNLFGIRGRRPEAAQQEV